MTFFPGDSGVVASVTINIQPAKLTLSTGSRLLVQLDTKTAAQEFTFERSIVLGSAVSALIIEAKDRADNLTRITLPLNPLPLPPRDSGFTGRKFAVVIGVSTYRDESISDLQFADDDARELRDFLLRPQGGGFKPGDILYLENEQATIEG